MISILYLSHCGSSIGGGEKQLAYLVTHLDRERYHPLVVCPDDGVFAEQLRGADIPTVILNLPPWRKAKSRIARHSAAAKLASLAKAHHTQLVHTSDSWLNPYVWYIRKHLKIPVVSNVRNVLTPTQVRKYRFDRMDSIIAISEQSKAPLVQAGIHSEKIDVILNCVDLSVFQPAPIGTMSECSPVPSAVRAEFSQGRSTSPFIIGIVGRIEPFKRQKAFVEIANEVFAQCKNVRFHIIGAALDMPEHRTYQREVRELVAKYQLNEAICFAGHRTDMPRVMQELHLLITLSAGSVIAEAMASGKPVIGTSIGSTSEMIVDDVTGWVMPAHPVEAIAARIVQLVKNPNRCAQMGCAARKQAVEAFGIQTHVQKVQNVYEKLLSAF